jgi:hypothetical protein
MNLTNSVKTLSNKIEDLHETQNRLTGFYPGNVHVCELSRHGAYVRSGELDGDQTKAEGHEALPRFGPLGRVMTYVLLV